LTIYRERRPPETEPLAVVQTNKLVVTTSEKKTLEGNIEDFFVLKGNFDYVSFKGGESDRYVVCWFDDKVERFHPSGKAIGRCNISPGMQFKVDERGKRTYNTTFKAEFGKLE